MFRRVFFLLLSLPAVAAQPVSRPGVLQLSLDSAIRMALAKNFSIQVSRFEPQIARQGVTRAQGRFDPVWDVQGRHGQESVRDVFEEGRHRPWSSFQRTTDVSSGLGGLTPWGLRYDVGLGVSGTGGSRFSSGDEYRSDVSVGVRQPLLRGFGADSNLAQIRIARNEVLVSESLLRERVIDTVTSTQVLYNELHLAHQNLAVAERSRELARQLLADNIKRAEIGVMSPLNITIARAEAAARQESVIVAQRQVKDGENLLKQLVTNDLEKMLSIQVRIEPPPSPPFKPDVPAAIRQALDLRPDYRQALLEIRKRQISLAFSRDQALPRFDLTASLHLLGLENDFGSSLDRTTRGDRTAWTAGAIFSVPIPNRDGRGGVAAAKLAAAQSLVELQRLEQQIVVEVDNASGRIITARERIASTSEARLLARESLEAGEERLRAGAGTTFEVLELQKKLAEAEVAELRARTDYNQAVARYHRLTGMTLREHGIQVD
jgi:outer membrane protein TolC